MFVDTANLKVSRNKLDKSNNEMFEPKQQGNIAVDKTKKHPEINYSNYDKLLNRFAGEFELVSNIGHLEWDVNGTWQMHRAYD
jgi:hypothetical protein